MAKKLTVGERIVTNFKYTVAFIVALAMFSGIIIVSSHITESVFGRDTNSFAWLVVFIGVLAGFLYAFQHLDKYTKRRFPRLHEHLKTWVPRG